VNAGKQRNPVQEYEQGREYIGEEETTNEDAMTLCIAAECYLGDTQCIAMCCDSRAERGGVFQELVGSEDVDKLREIGPVTAMLSGGETHADELLTLCEDAIRNFAVSVPVGDSDLAITKFMFDLRTAAAKRKRTLVEHHLEMTIAMPYEDFVKRHKSEFSDPYSRDIWNQIQHIDLGADLILCGFSDDESVIIRLDRYGITHWETNYSVVGVGDDIAYAFLCQRQWHKESEYDDEDESTEDEIFHTPLQLPDALYRIVEAKWAAEKNRHVGDATTFEILMPDGRRFGIARKCFMAYKEAFKARMIVKPFLFTENYLIEEKDEDETDLKTPGV
jgi:hypothetical protein